ncbi:hypothetical protein BDZ91DRAFT_786036 [Kalaharituber pfeilii]|nr:hypothetical protein BDZ91DRAFT_786036 [Kalaharituber pfeilii]
MPRRIWDLKSNRVVDFRMLHAEVNSIEVPHKGTRRPTFWAVSHSWTSDMRTVETSVNQYQWPVPLPNGVDIESLRKELLTLGADYVWLDVLCLRQQSGTSTAQTRTHNNVPLDTIKHDEWKIDVPTIGNIYRAAVQTVRYFNGLGRPFSKEGWDDPRHWLRRAWTLQEIRTENRTFNGGVLRGNGRIILNTKGTIAGKVTTLRGAIRPVLKLATDAGSPGGCKLYELTREMASRCATQPTDKVAGLFYLLRATQLPTYDENINDETAWRQCFHVLPFGKKIEILFDFPYRGTEQQWFPTWKQVMEWPERDQDYEHTPTEWPQNRRIPELIEPKRDLEHIFLCEVWAISHALVHKPSEVNEYEVKIGSEVFGFYCPYLSQAPIETDDRQFTLAILDPEQTYNNWVVCKQLNRENGRYRSEDEDESTIELEVLKKVGVLRTDSNSDFLVLSGDGDSVMRKINALFV